MQTRRDLAQEAYETLAAKQTEPRAFYSYKSLRESFPDAFGTGQIKRTTGALRTVLYQKGVKVEDGRSYATAGNLRGVWISFCQNLDSVELGCFDRIDRREKRISKEAKLKK